MASDFYITNCITIVCFVYILIILIMFFLKGRTHRISGKVFFSLLICTMLCIISFTIWSVFATNLSEFAITFGKILCFILVCWDYLLIFYIAIVFKGDKENEEFYKKHNVISYVLGGLLVLINVICCVFLEFEIESGFDNRLFLLGGSLNTYITIMGGISLLYSVVTMIIYRSKIDKTTSILGVFSIIICLLSIITGVSGIMPMNDICFLYTVVIMFLYLCIESQDGSLLEEFNLSNIKAEESNRIKSEFITNMSHQLRTPMNTIIGFTDSLLTSEGLSQEEFNDNTNDIEAASKKLFDLVSSILDISKLDSNKEKINNEDYKLDSVIFDISSHVNGLIDKENLVFCINVNEDVYNYLNGDDYKLAKILNVLLAYSVKYTNYGKISLDVTCDFNDNEFHEFVFHIKNNANIMKNEYFTNSFEDLIKLNFNTKDGINVDILKIIVVRGLIDIIGGSIEFKNNEGSGEEFIFKVKQKVLSDERIGNIASKIQINHSTVLDIANKKCLIVDDAGINTIVLDRLLKPYNLNVEYIINPRDALSKASYSGYDIIFINHNMEEMNGSDFVKKLEGGGNKIPPVIALTSVSDIMNDESVYFDHIMCPIEERVLKKVLNKVFSGGDQDAI